MDNSKIFYDDDGRPFTYVPIFHPPAHLKFPILNPMIQLQDQEHTGVLDLSNKSPVMGHSKRDDLLPISINNNNNNNNNSFVIEQENLHNHYSDRDGSEVSPCYYVSSSFSQAESSSNSISPISVNSSNDPMFTISGIGGGSVHDDRDNDNNDDNNYSERRISNSSSGNISDGRAGSYRTSSNADGREKDEAYYERRRKNNIAAKRSRDAKRKREADTKARLLTLESENKRLRQELTACRCRLRPVVTTSVFNDLVLSLQKRPLCNK